MGAFPDSTKQGSSPWTPIVDQWNLLTAFKQDVNGPFPAGQITGILGVPHGGTGLGTFTANLPLIGNGAGAIAQGTLSGNTNQFATVTGGLTNGDCVSVGSGGNLIDAGAACATGTGSGTVAAATVGQIAQYSGTTTVAGINVVPAKNGGPPCPNLEQFGGAGDGSTDNTAALNAAFASFGSSSGCVGFGAGTYIFDSAISFSYSGSATQSITLRGVGQDVSILKWPNATNGLAFTMAGAARPSFHISDLSFTSAATPGSHSAFSANNVQALQGDYPQSNITNVTFRGDNLSVLTDCWDNAVTLTGVSIVNIEGVVAFGCPTGSPISGGTGNGIVVQGNTGIPSYAVVINIDHTYLQYFQTGFVYGSYIQGVTIANSNINFNTFGIQSSSSETGVLGQLSVSNTQISNFSNNVTTNTAIASINFSNDLFLIANGTAGIVCSPCAGGTIVGNTFEGSASPTGSTGIFVGTNGGPLMISGNDFTLLATAINASAGSSHCNIQSNAYLANTSNVGNFGTCTAGGGSQ